MSKYNQGKYTVKFPEKYAGDPTMIIYRSGWELRFMLWCDSNPSIIKWQSEETIVPYRCATDNKIHRYYLDFKIQVLTKTGNIKTYLIEIKPHAQTIPPVFKGRQTKRYLAESMTFLKNQSKWKAAEEYAKARGWEFIKLTEYDLGLDK